MEKNLTRLWMVIVMGFWILPASSQFEIQGKVFDNANQEALEGVTIYNLLDSSFTSTDHSGFFRLVSSRGLGVIEVSRLGYKPLTFERRETLSWLNIGLEPDAQLLEHITVRAYSQSTEIQNYAGSLSIIPKSVLTSGNEVNIEPALNNVPGLYMHSGALNTSRITMRGIGSRSLFSTSKIRAYFNDIPLTNGIGETTLEDIDLSLINNIQVLKGPASSNYGAGLGGTIILNSEKNPYKQSSFENSLSAGSFGLFRHTHILGHSSDQMNISLNFNRVHSDGYRENNEYDRNSLAVLGQFYVGSSGVLSFVGNYIHLKAFIPSSLDSLTFVNNPSEAAFTWKKTMGSEDYDKSQFGVSYKHELYKNLFLNSAFFTGAFQSFEVRPFNILDENQNNNGFRISLEYNSLKSDQGILLTAGGEYYHEKYNWNTFENTDGTGVIGPVLSDNKEQRTYFNLFGKSSLRLNEKWEFSFGMNLNKTKYSIQDLYTNDSVDFSGNFAFKGILSPRFAGVFSPSKNISIHGSISHGFSPPSLEETLTPEGQVNPEIKPETGWNFELGSRGHFLDRKLHYDISIYTLLVKNLLVARRVGQDIFVGVNAGKTTHSGIEMTLSANILDSGTGIFKSLKAGFTYAFAWYKFTDFMDGELDYSGNFLPGAPRHNAGLQLDMEIWEGFSIHSNLKTISKMPILDDNSIFSSAYSVLDLKVGYERILKNSFLLNLFFGLNNVSNTHYASMLQINAGSFGGNPPRYYYPGLPRNWYAGVKLKYLFKGEF